MPIPHRSRFQNLLYAISPSIPSTSTWNVYCRLIWLSNWQTIIRSVSTISLVTPTNASEYMVKRYGWLRTALLFALGTIQAHLCFGRQHPCGLLCGEKSRYRCYISFSTTDCKQENYTKSMTETTFYEVLNHVRVIAQNNYPKKRRVVSAFIERLTVSRWNGYSHSVPHRDGYIGQSGYKR